MSAHDVMVANKEIIEFLDRLQAQAEEIRQVPMSWRKREDTREVERIERER